MQIRVEYLFCNRKTDEMKIYNYVSGPENPVTWQKYIDEMLTIVKSNYSIKQVWYEFFYLVQSKTVFYLLNFLFHALPAYVVDFFALIIGQEPK